jgi:hypothetical protein
MVKNSSHAPGVSQSEAKLMREEFAIATRVVSSYR